MAETPVSEWVAEHGIGETRAVLLNGGEVIGAKLYWPGELLAGQHIRAKLTSKPAGARRGIAKSDAGEELLVDHLPAHLTQGGDFTLTVTRAAISERGRLKKAQGRFAEEPAEKGAEWPNDASFIRSFQSGVWEEIWHAASTGDVPFKGGSILFSVTPAMTLIDVDGDGSPREIGLTAAPVIAQWLHLFGLGGNIGIDFPTMQTKADRRAVDEALAAALTDWPHERTAMNGFGFVQLVARLEGPSLLHRFATTRTGMCARFALRVAERAQGTGTVLQLRIHPALKAKLKPEWLDELARRTGKEVRIETDPGLALEAPQAQIIEV